VPTDPYVYPGSDCLRNRLGIRDAKELECVEAERTSSILALLECSPIPGRYDVDHLKTFHRLVFGDIYDWAGELRTLAIAREQSLFALPEHIEPYQLRGVLARLALAASQIAACYERYGPDQPWGFADPTSWKCSPRFCHAWASCPGGKGL
jgi:cell filamentation protein